MLDKIITYSFYSLFFLTPLFWSSLNYELFEFNKMILVYVITVIVIGSWLLKSVIDGQLSFKRTPLDIPLLLFLGANILSTIFSIDPHTSIWGYYSRSNGGLLSLISYLLLYWAFVANMDKTKVLTTLKFGLLSGFIISIWAILEHLGVSFSCVILRGELNASCWVQDVQARVFATLGQPNWLAAYLSMLIFPAFYFFLTANSRKEKIIYFTSLVSMYLAFTFTYSRGPTLGLIAGFLIMFPLIFGSTFFTLFYNIFSIASLGGDIIESNLKFFQKSAKPFLLVLLTFFIVNLLFGSALNSFKLVSKFAPPPRPAIALPPSSVTQLENGGTESGQIRFIVWKGAIDIFKAYPLFGSGLETFAYSYYQFRPVTHNLTSEWDFLYNKAHNEYLNYLATTGLVGFGTYLILIGAFILWSVKKKDMLVICLFASFISYLVYNFFLFSVVIIAVFFYLFPALAFVASENTKPINLRLPILNWVNRGSIYENIVKGVIIFLTISFLFSIYKLWLADTLFNQGQGASDAGNPGRAYNILVTASSLNPGEPFYRSELAYNAASTAVALASSEATLSAALKEEAVMETDNVLSSSPKNTSFWRVAIRTYFELSTIDPTYTDKALQALDKAISLAPTDPKLYYNKALILESIGKKDESIILLEKTLSLKPNYIEVKAKLEESTKSAEAK